MKDDDDDSAFNEENVVDVVGARVPPDVDLGNDGTGGLSIRRVRFTDQHSDILLEEEVDQKSMHIIIQSEVAPNVSLPESPCCPLVINASPLPPPTPATPHGRARGFRYQWTASAFDPVIPVRCKSSNGELHKAKFGSGGRGRCIKFADAWYTPSEFEAVSGRSSSKDWKRSVHYGGRTLQCLIEDGLLDPHATSCTCAACCDDDSVMGPVRLFQPYKRRKRDYQYDMATKKFYSSSTDKTASLHTSKEDAQVTFAGDLTQTMVVTESSSSLPEAAEMLDGLPADHLTANLAADQLLLTGSSPTISERTSSSTVAMTTHLPPAAIHPSVASSSTSLAAIGAIEQKLWSQLEDMANNLMAQAQNLKQLVELAKQQSSVTREATVNLLRAQYEKEKKDAVHEVQVEAQMALTRAAMDARTVRDIAVQEALAQARAELHEKLNGSGAQTVVLCADDKNTYTVTWATRHDEIGGGGEEENNEGRDK